MSQRKLILKNREIGIISHPLISSQQMNEKLTSEIVFPLSSGISKHQIATGVTHSHSAKISKPLHDNYPAVWKTTDDNAKITKTHDLSSE